jgi:hypothetical protein
MLYISLYKRARFDIALEITTHVTLPSEEGVVTQEYKGVAMVYRPKAAFDASSSCRSLVYPSCVTVDIGRYGWTCRMCV